LALAEKQGGAPSMDKGAVDLEALPHRIHDPLDYWAARAPNAPALTDTDARVLTYAALREGVEAISVILAQAGVRGGDRVLIVNENSAAAVAALFAASRLDAWAVPVNARLTPVEIDRIRQHARPRAILFSHMVSQEAAAHAERHNAAAETATAAGRVRIIGGLESEPEPVSKSGASQVAAVIYTSGTTGSPKGVMLTHRNLLFNAIASGRLRRMVSGDFVVQLVPISHVFGLTSVLLCAISAGARILLVPRFDPARLANALENGITILQGVPAMYAKLLEHLETTNGSLSAPGLRYMSAGGSPLDIDWKRSIERRFGLPLNNGYGLTESSSALAITRVEAPRDDDSVGLPLPGVEVRFVGTDGMDVADGEIGEGWVRGPDVMRGY
jgi:acyl-CoA synthetase (AMP-forming)/AMP-acid ligase II